MPSRLKDTRTLMMTLSLGSTPSGCFEHTPTRSRNAAVQSSLGTLVSTGRRGKPAAKRSAESHVLCDRLRKMRLPPP